MDDTVAAAPLAGAHPSPGTGRRAVAIIVAIAVVGAAWWLLQLRGLGATPFHTRGEPREAVVVQDLVRNGDWILPKRNGAQLPRKPPLFYWLAALAARVHGGVDEASVRFPSAALSGACAVMVAAVSATFYGAAAGVFAGIGLLTSFEWLRAATAARVDMTLAFGLTLSFVALTLFRSVERRIWAVLFFAGAAWATLSKGIPGLAIPAFAVLLLSLLADRNFAFVRRLHPIVGLLAVLAISGAWYAAAAAQGGREFVTIVINENIGRAVSEDAVGLGHRHSFQYLVAVLLLGLLPWTVLLPSVAAALWRDRGGIGRWDPRLVALLWMIAVFVPHAFAASKRGVYLLPLFPAVAFLLGWWASRLFRGADTAPWLARLLMPLAWLLATLLALLGVATAAQSIGFPLLDAVIALLPPGAAIDVHPVAAAATLPLAGAFLLSAAAAGGVAVAAARRHWVTALPALVLCLIALVVAVRGGILPAIAAAQSRRDFAVALRRAVADPATLHTAGGLDYGTLFYWGEPVRVYDAAAPGDPPPYLVVPEPQWWRMPPTVRRHYRRIPGLTIERGGDEGYVAVLQYVGEPDQ